MRFHVKDECLMHKFHHFRPDEDRSSLSKRWQGLSNLKVGFKKLISSCITANSA